MDSILVVVVVRVVLAIVLVSGTSTVVSTVSGSAMAGGGQSVQMRGTSVLHLCGLNGHSVVDHRNVDGSLVGVAAGVAAGMAAGVTALPATVVVAIVPGSVRGATVRGSLRKGSVMGGLGVLYLGGVNGHSVVDHRDVVAAVRDRGDGVAGTGGSMGGEVSGLGVLNLRGLNWGSMGVGHMTQGLGVGSVVLGLGGLHIGGIYWHSAVGERDMGSLSVGPATAVDRSLVQMVAGVVGSSSVGGGMGSLGVLYLGRVNGNSSVGQHWDVDGSVGMGMGVGHIGGVGGSIEGSMHLRSLGKVGAYGVETVVGIGGVGHGLDMTMPVHVGVGAVRGAIMTPGLVLL